MVKFRLIKHLVINLKYFSYGFKKNVNLNCNLMQTVVSHMKVECTTCSSTTLTSTPHYYFPLCYIKDRPILALTLNVGTGHKLCRTVQCEHNS